MKYLSLFSGIGGFELGIQQAYEIIGNFSPPALGKREKIEERKLQKNGKRLHSVSSKRATPAHDWNNELLDGSIDKGQPHCVGYSEFDPSCDRQGCKGYHTAIEKYKSKCDTCGKIKTQYAPIVYDKHFKHKNYGDITKINPRDLPDFELLVGGFPCQSFSIAGKRAGFEDTRGTMFFEIARIIREKQPRLLLLENVKGLLSHDKGQTFFTIISTLDELGYDCQWQVLNSKNHGVPQSRERVFIVGHLRGTPRPEVFPFGEADTAHTKNNKNKVARCIDANYAKGWLDNGQRTMVQVKEATKKGYAEAREGDSINLSVPNSKTRRGRIGKGIAQTIDTGMQQHTLNGSRVRRLTPTECERLQGFPDGWTEEVSNTQRYKTLGNAVTVNVIRDIMLKIL